MAYTTGQLAQIAGVNVETIRFYERRGLLRPAGRRPSGYRQFSTDSVTRILFIKRAQELGFSLTEIQELLELQVESDSVCADVCGRAESKVKLIEEKIVDLKRILSVLLQLLKTCETRGTTDDCPILDALEDRSDDSPFTPEQRQSESESREP